MVLFLIVLLVIVLVFVCYWGYEKQGGEDKGED
jgi:hypothetical protein